MTVRIPDEIRYTTHHTWIRMIDDFTGRCGISREKVDLMGDLRFIDLPEIDISFKAGEPVGYVESDTEQFTVRSPVSGRIVEINRRIQDNPRTVNESPLDEGWLFALDVKEPNEFLDTLHEEEYRRFCEAEGIL